MTALALHVEQRMAAGDDASRLPLVLLHGWGMNLRVFDPLRERLAHRTTIAIDLPGHGRSPWDPGMRFEDLCEAVRAALPARCVLLGWSLGAKIALTLAAEEPQRIAALILLSASPRFAQSPDWPQGMPDEHMRAFRAVLEQDWERTLSDFIWLQVRGSQNADATVEALQSALQAHGAPRRDALVAGMQWLSDVDVRAKAARVRQPALVVTGRNDRVTSPAAAEWLAANIANAQLTLLPRAGHAPQLSHTAELAARIQLFLASVDTALP